VFYIGFVVGREDKDIIEVGNTKDIKVALEGNIYIILEAYRGVRKSKGYYYIFKIAISSIEGYFLFIALFNIDPVVYVLDVDLTKVLYLGKIVKNF